MVPEREHTAINPSVLVVDADALTRAAYRQSFARDGCEVTEAADGREALTKALLRPPTLVVTDVRLPFIDGYALCEILRKDRTTADVPILVVTAESRPVALDRAVRAGADTVLAKSARIDDIVAASRKLIASAKQMRALAAAARELAAEQSATTRRQRMRMSKAFARFATTTPPGTPPPLVCPACDRPMTYQQSHIGGVSERHAEQWDEYTCPAACGVFQYRHRTRKLRRIA
jgi:CheY-like chemotaxis protein